MTAFSEYYYYSQRGFGQDFIQSYIYFLLIGGMGMGIYKWINRAGRGEANITILLQNVKMNIPSDSKGFKESLRNQLTDYGNAGYSRFNGSSRDLLIKTIH